MLAGYNIDGDDFLLWTVTGDEIWIYCFEPEMK
jgi:hypothetical protein